MDTRQIAYRILRHCSPNSLSELSMMQGAEVAGAISTALADFYARVPTTFRKTTASADLEGTVAVTGLGMTRDSVAVTGVEFDDKYVGSTIVINGERHEIDSPTSLMDTFKGTTGTYAGTIHHDAVPMGSNRMIQRLTNDPWVIGGNGQETRQLMRVTHDHAPLNVPAYWSFPDWRDGAVGNPTHYAVVSTGNSQNAEQWWMLKVHPAPTQAVTLRFDLELDPNMISFLNLTYLPLILPVSDADYEAILRPMAEREMLASSIWTAGKLAVQAVQENYQRALELIARKLPDRGPTLGRMGTPYGF